MSGSALSPTLVFPLGGPPPALGAAQAVVDVLGVDILFTSKWLPTIPGGLTSDVSGLPVGGNGDYIEVAGIENLRRAVLRRLITKPGEYRPFPTYGVGLGTYVKKPMTGALLAQLQHAILDNLSQEKRIDKVISVEVTPTFYTTQSGQQSPGLSVVVVAQAIGRTLQFEHSQFRVEVT